MVSAGSETRSRVVSVLSALQGSEYCFCLTDSNTDVYFFLEHVELLSGHAEIVGVTYLCDEDATMRLQLCAVKEKLVYPIGDFLFSDAAFFKVLPYPGLPHGILVYSQEGFCVIDVDFAIADDYQFRLLPADDERTRSWQLYYAHLLSKFPASRSEDIFLLLPERLALVVVKTSAKVAVCVFEITAALDLHFKGLFRFSQVRFCGIDLVYAASTSVSVPAHQAMLLCYDMNINSCQLAPSVAQISCTLPARVPVVRLTSGAQEVLTALLRAKICVHEAAYEDYVMYNEFSLKLADAKSASAHSTALEHAPDRCSAIKHAEIQQILKGYIPNLKFPENKNSRDRVAAAILAAFPDLDCGMTGRRSGKAADLPAERAAAKPKEASRRRKGSDAANEPLDTDPWIKNLAADIMRQTRRSDEPVRKQGDWKNELLDELRCVVAEEIGRAFDRLLAEFDATRLLSAYSSAHELDPAIAKPSELLLSEWFKRNAEKAKDALAGAGPGPAAGAVAGAVAGGIAGGIAGVADKAGVRVDVEDVLKIVHADAHDAFEEKLRELYSARLLGQPGKTWLTHLALFDTQNGTHGLFAALAAQKLLAELMRNSLFLLLFVCDALLQFLLCRAATDTPEGCVQCPAALAPRELRFHDAQLQLCTVSCAQLFEDPALQRAAAAWIARATIFVLSETRKQRATLSATLADARFAALIHACDAHLQTAQKAQPLFEAELGALAAAVELLKSELPAR